MDGARAISTDFDGMEDFFPDRKLAKALIPNKEF